MARFDDCLAFILEREGGYVDLHADHGGPTNKGVTQTTYDNYRTAHALPLQSVQYMTDPECRAIYSLLYWAPLHADVLPQPIDLVMFDAAVQHGVSRAVKLLQGTVAGMVVDGIMGVATMAVTHGGDPLKLAGQIIWARQRFYDRIVLNDPTQAVFLNGWKNRLVLLQKAAGLPEA